MRVSRDADTRLDLPAGEHQAEPHVAVDPTDPLHLAAAAHEGRFFDGGAHSIGAYVSWNGGRTWTNELLPRLTVKTGGVWERATDPVAGFAADGTAYINSFAFNRTTGDETAVVVHRSDDGGLTWKGPFVACAMASSDRAGSASDLASRSRRLTGRPAHPGAGGHRGHMRSDVRAEDGRRGGPIAARAEFRILEQDPSVQDPELS